MKLLGRSSEKSRSSGSSVGRGNLATGISLAIRLADFFGKTGLSDDILEKEWQRFMSQDALPVIETHVREFAHLAFGVFESALSDPRTKETLPWR